MDCGSQCSPRKSVLATGGIGACFDRTTNPGTSRGAGLAAAARSGVRLADLEFLQFHPTALAVEADPLPLLTEALRGAGATLLDDSGGRFMRAVHPDAELAPRDVVARRVAALQAAGQAVWLDASGIPDLAAQFPAACAIAASAGLDARCESASRRDRGTLSYGRRRNRCRGPVVTRRIVGLR